MHFLLPLLVALFASDATAKICRNLTVAVNIEARQGVFSIPDLQGNLDATAFAQRLTSNHGNYTEDALDGYQTVEGTYNISTTFCQPDTNASGTTVQVLSHGIGYDKTYWDIRYENGNYSYVDVAVDEYGYSTVAIDRFGIGNSSHGHPLNLIQAPAEISALHEITKLLRNGSFPTVPTAFKNIITVGHSFGSIQVYTLSALDPSAQDALILTGFSGDTAYLPATIAAWNLHLARLNQPSRFGSARPRTTPSRFDRPVNLYTLLAQSLRGAGLSDSEVQQELTTTELANLLAGSNATSTTSDSAAAAPQDLPAGYLTWPDFSANQYTFFYPGAFDLGLGLQIEATKQPVTTGELLTLASFPGSTGFAGPVQVVTGEKDAIFCGGDCYAVGAGSSASNIPAEVAPAFPNASVFEAYVQPNTGHAINAHYNATGAYHAVQRFLGANGFGAS